MEKLSTAVVEATRGTEKSIESLNGTAARIDEKVRSMTDDQREKFRGLLQRAFLPDDIERSERGYLSAFAGFIGGFGLTADKFSQMVELPTAMEKVREAAAALSALPSWENSDAVQYIFFQSIANTPKVAAIGGTVGLATCVAGWISEKLRGRNEG